MIDEQLIQEIISGNTLAFKTLMEKYRERVFHVAMGFVHLKEDAEDLTQEVFIKVYLSLSTFNHDSEFSTWLYRLTINTCINFVNRNRSKRFLQSIEEVWQSAFGQHDNEKTPLEKIEVSERNLLIKKAIDSLPDKQRSAFVLSKYEDLSQKEVAAIMNITEGAVEQLLQRAKNNLRKKLGPSIGN